MLGKKQKIALTEESFITADRNELLEITTKFYSNLYKDQEKQDEDKEVHTTNEKIPDVFVEEVEVLLKNMKNYKTGGRDGTITKIIKYAHKPTCEL